ncbi:MAG TPA: helix-turn-helix transcriptional regulator [Chloroflexia bacterium]|jgi:tetratricopeptide (TPR) repeat protein
MIGKLIKLVREEQGLQPEELGEPEFSGAYIEALERGAIRPSRMALELIAKRLQLSPDRLHVVEPEIQQAHQQVEPDGGEAVRLQPVVKAYEEDLHFQLNYATTLIHRSDVENALSLINTVEVAVSPFSEQLSIKARYRLPYLRGMANLQVGQPGAAQVELETALEVAGIPVAPSRMRSYPSANDAVAATQVKPSAQSGSRRTEEMVLHAAGDGRGGGTSGMGGAGGTSTHPEEPGDIEARIRNLLGVAYYMQKRLQDAEEQHMSCLHASEDGKIKDIGLRFSIYRNLANDYWACGKYEQAITISLEALRLFQDLADPLRLAGLEWGLTMAYKAAGERGYAKLHAQKALDIYRAREFPIATATMAINLAELLIDDGQYPEAEPLLAEAEALLHSSDALVKSKAVAAVALTALSPETAVPLTLSNLYQNRARLARAQGQLHAASQQARRSIELAEAVYRAEAAGAEDTTGTGSAAGASIHPAHYYAQALHTGALVEEAMGVHRAADQLFERALALVEGTGFERAREAIMRSYADVLKARGDFQNAARYLDQATQVRIGAR